MFSQLYIQADIYGAVTPSHILTELFDVTIVIELVILVNFYI